ncbi:MAG: Ig-like domain-containing protein [Burkholderiales bacterium]|nr:Ig-like domain-containing protein [Burkholderiales bacterium]
MTNVETIQFSDQSVWIGLADTTAPTVTTFSPADEATGVAVGSNVVFDFQRRPSNAALAPSCSKRQLAPPWPPMTPPPAPTSPSRAARSPSIPAPTWATVRLTR